LLYHRCYCLSLSYPICVPMHYLPDPFFRSKDHRYPQSEWHDILPLANLALVPLYYNNVGNVPLYYHNVGKLRSYVRRYRLKANNPPISEM
jgi:hypothetical protein